jgi:hypothetical protein
LSRPPSKITCIECDGVAHLISFLPEDDEPLAGLSYSYRCADCMDRFDVVWDEDE